VTLTLVPEAGAYLYQELAVTQPGDDTRAHPLLILLGAVATALGPLHDLARHPERLLDPDEAPAFALPYLGQFAGVHFPTGLPESEQRQRIVTPPAFSRGTPQAMIAATAATLTGTRAVRLIERDGDPYNLTVITRTAETPDPAASEAAARSQKPAGMLLAFTVSDAPLISEGNQLIDSVSATIDAAVLADVS
jgi:hypothetical protein